MSRREIIAYAITHAPPGVKGGPYEAAYPAKDEPMREQAHAIANSVLARVRVTVPHARVIRIVRKARPSEASAVEVLRELVAWCGAPRHMGDIIARARAVLAASGPDPMPVVRAALEEMEAEEAFRDAKHCGRRGEAAALDAASRARVEAVKAYRKAGGK